MLRLMTLALVIAGVLSVGILVARNHLQTRIEAERAAVRAMGYPATLEELNERVGEPPRGAERGRSLLEAERLVCEAG